MDREAERELAVVILEEKAKVVLGDGYLSLPYPDWVEELKSFVLTQLCPDCLEGYDLDDPAEEIWGWFVVGEPDDDNGLEELEVVEFFCLNSLDKPEAEREMDHPKSWGTLIFRRPPTGTFPLDEDDAYEGD